MFTPKEIIQFDLRTCFKWFGFQPPTRPSMFFRCYPNISKTGVRFFQDTFFLPLVFFPKKNRGIPWKIPDVQNQAGRDGGDNGEHLRHAENVIPFLRFFFQNPGLNDYRYILQGSLTGNHFFWGGQT